MSKNVYFAGSLIVDNVKTIDAYPAEGMLVNILKTEHFIGGLVNNTGIDLKRLSPDIPVYAIGRIGKDADGAYILDTLTRNGVDVSMIIEDDSLPTSYTDVMHVEGGARTFFQAQGANAAFCPADIPFSRLEAGGFFHAGYALLLNTMDSADEEYGTPLARTLCAAQAAGLKTSIDVVSESGDRYKRVIVPALKYCDNVILNEVESGLIAGIAPRGADGKIDADAMRRICAHLKGFGVKENVIIHCPEAGYLLDADGNFFTVPSLKLPAGYIKGSTGAGDAFCAGALYALYHGLDAEKLLGIAAASAACNLAAVDSVGGARSIEETLKLFDKYCVR